MNESDIKHKEISKEQDLNTSSKKNETNGKLDEMEEDEDDFDNNTNDIFTYAATSSNKNEAKILQKILLKLKSRFKSRVVLQETVNSLSNLNTKTNIFFWLNLQLFCFFST